MMVSLNVMSTGPPARAWHLARAASHGALREDIPPREFINDYPTCETEMRTKTLLTLLCSLTATAAIATSGPQTAAYATPGQAALVMRSCGWPRPYPGAGQVSPW